MNAYVQSREVHYDQGHEGATLIFQTWLEEMGLDFNPFSALDAGLDPEIPRYLVRHDEFERIKSETVAFVFAPPGGGKTSFRVRLARACRERELGIPVFPVSYQVPDISSAPNQTLAAVQHLERICNFAAQELLLYLAYHPALFSGLDEAVQVEIRSALEWNLPFPLEYYIDQIESTGNLHMLVEAIDPTAGSLSNPPGIEDILPFCKALMQSRIPTDTPDEPEERFQQLTQLVLGPLGFQAIYLLVDGVDGYFPTATSSEQAMKSLDYLLKQSTEWAKEKIYSKFFLPSELYNDLFRKFPSWLLTPTIKFAIINWSETSLTNLIRERLHVASGGKFDSLDAISTPRLRYAEQRLARLANSNPRLVIRLVDQLFGEHVRRSKGTGKLGVEDLTATCKWLSEHPEITS